jgi:hypothetical protein
MEEYNYRNFKKHKVSIYDLSEKSREILIEKGILEYVHYRSSIKIDKLILYGRNAEFVKYELSKYNFFCEIGLDSNYGIYDNIWHLDIDDLIELYSLNNL